MNLYDLVLTNVFDLSRIRREDIRPEHTLVGDLKMDGDELSFVFVPALEKALKIKTNQADWDSVRTVQEVVEMLQRKVSG